MEREPFTAIPNDILSIVPHYKLNATQLNIVLVVWRYTFGYNRQDHDISVSFVTKATGIHLAQVKEEMKTLIEKRVLIVTKEATKSESRRIGFNENFEQWNVENRIKSKEVVKTLPGGGSENTTSEVVKTLPGGGSEFTTQERKVLKENSKEKYNISAKVQFADTVFLTTEQYEKLCCDFGKETADLYIEKIDEWQTNNPKKARVDHNKTIRVWIRNDEKKTAASGRSIGGIRNSKTQHQMDILQNFAMEDDEVYEQIGNRQALGSGEDGLF